MGLTCMRLSPYSRRARAPQRGATLATRSSLLSSPLLSPHSSPLLPADLCCPRTHTSSAVHSFCFHHPTPAFSRFQLCISLSLRALLPLQSFLTDDFVFFVSFLASLVFHVAWGAMRRGATQSPYIVPVIPAQCSGISSVLYRDAVASVWKSEGTRGRERQLSGEQKASRRRVLASGNCFPHTHAHQWGARP